MNNRTGALLIAAALCVFLEMGALALIFSNLDFENDPVTRFETITNWIGILLVVVAPAIAYTIYRRLSGDATPQNQELRHRLIPLAVVLVAAITPFVLLAAPGVYSSLRRDSAGRAIEANRERSAAESRALKAAAEAACVKSDTLLYDRTYGLQGYINTINAEGTSDDKTYLQDQVDQIDDIRAQCQRGDFDGIREKRLIQPHVDAIAVRANQVKTSQ